MPRTLDNCSKCGEEKELVSHGRCAKCNMQEVRAEQAARRAAKGSNKVKGIRVLATLIANIQDVLDFHQNLSEEDKQLLVTWQIGVRKLLRQWASPEAEGVGVAIEPSDVISQGSNAPLPS
jgi:hypothetical protein